jgi:hypothetical protein
MLGIRIGRVERACGTAACKRDCYEGCEFFVLRAAVSLKENLLLSNAIPAAFGERNTIRAHDLELLGVCVDPAGWLEGAWIGEDGGIVVHPVCGHGDWCLETVHG